MNHITARVALSLPRNQWEAYPPPLVSEPWNGDIV